MFDRSPALKPCVQSAVLWLIAPWLVGCNLMFSVPMPAGPESLLTKLETSPESVTLEIFQLRVPTKDPQWNDQLWQAVDEQRLEVDVRHELIRNGFRAGVLTGAIPEGLANRLNLQSELPEVSPERVITQQSADPQVVGRVLQLNRHESAIIQASDLVSQLHVLVSDENGVGGRTYEQVEAVYSMRAEATAGQRVLLRLTPELRHGELKNRYAGSDQGIFLVTPSRERESYDQLKITTTLAAGELLVLSCLPDAAGSLGHAFHTQKRRGPTDYKLILVRLVEVPGSEILADAR